MGVQVMYVIMMYVSVYPVVITMRHSNVYEERSLGIYDQDPAASADAEEPGLWSQQPAARRRQGTLGTALKRSLSFRGVGAQAAPHDESSEESRVSFISQQIR